MGVSRGGPAARFCGRLVAMLGRDAFLIVDRVQTQHPARIESRLHTYAEVRLLRRGAVLTGEKESLRVCYAANVPSLLARATTAPTRPTSPCATMLRWCTDRLHRDMVLVTLLTPGRGRARVVVASDGRGFRLVVEVGGRRRIVSVRPSLKPA
jgi:hypothetical protein